MTLPAGYIELKGVAMHVAECRKYTSDIERFKRHLPLMRELNGVESGSPEAFAIYDKADDLEALALSLEEYGNLCHAESKSLQAEKARRKA